MATRQLTAVAGNVLTAAAWNTEFDEIFGANGRAGITDANVNAAAAIARSKLANTESNQITFAAGLISQSPILYKPSVDPAANTKLLDLQNAAGVSRFSVDLEGDIAVIGAIIGSLIPDANATRNLGSSTTRWNAIFGASLDMSGNLTVNGTGPHTFGGHVIGTSPAARVYHSVAQSIANSTFVILNFDSENFDNDSIHDNVTNNSRLTCKTAGTYLIVAGVTFAAVAGGYRLVNIKKNGAANIAFENSQSISDAKANICTAIASLAVNDYVEVEVYQNSGGALNVSQQSFSMVHVG